MRTPLTKYTEPYTIYELMQGLQANDLALSYTVDDETKTFCTDAIAADVLERFQDRVVFIPGNEELTTAQRRTAFLKLYNNWWNRRKDQFGRLMDAFAMDYDPLTNYDRREVGGWSDTHNIGARSSTDNLTDSYGATQSTTTDTPRVVTQTQTTAGITTTANAYTFGDNSSTEAPTEKTVTTPSGSETVTVTPTEGTNQSVTANLARSDTHNRSESSVAAVDSDVHAFSDYRVFGNIGVTTAAQMLTGELELRGAYDLIEHAILEFVNMVSVYI